MKRHTYEATIEQQEDGWFVRFPQLPEAYTGAASREEAIRGAAEVLELIVAGRIEDGRPLPQPRHVAECISVSIALTQADLEEMHYMTMQQAADDLEVGLPRVSALVKAGKLDSRHFDGTHKVSISSVNQYKATPRKAGRPPGNG